MKKFRQQPSYRRRELERNGTPQLRTGRLPLPLPLPPLELVLRQRETRLEHERPWLESPSLKRRQQCSP